LSNYRHSFDQGEQSLVIYLSIIGMLFAL